MIDTIFKWLMITGISTIVILLVIGWNDSAIPKWVVDKIRKVVKK